MTEEESGDGFIFRHPLLLSIACVSFSDVLAKNLLFVIIETLMCIKDRNIGGEG